MPELPVRLPRQCQRDLCKGSVGWLDVEEIARYLKCMANGPMDAFTRSLLHTLASHLSGSKLGQTVVF